MNEDNITWKEACEQVNFELMSDISGPTVEKWFVIYKFNNYEFPLSQQGKNTVCKDFNPLSTCNCKRKTVRDNEDLCEELRK